MKKLHVTHMLLIGYEILIIDRDQLIMMKVNQ